MPDLAALTADDFAPLVGDRFRLAAPDGRAVDVTLRAATSEPAAAAPGARGPFSVMFGGPAAPIVPQGIQRLHHPALGELELFLVPVTPDACGARYQAVFA